MRVSKLCHYCGTTYNLLPAVLVTPLYRITSIDPAPMSLKYFGYTRNPGHLTVSGLRIALKFWRFHLGMEIDYESR